MHHVKVLPEHMLCDSLGPTACATPANMIGQDVAELRKKLQAELVIVDRMFGELLHAKREGS